MLSVLKNERSLTFHPATMYAGSIVSPMAANISLATTVTTTRFNNQLNNFMNVLTSERHRISEKVAAGLSNNPAYDKARNDGVKLAWEYEKADIQMGGKGAGNFDAGQRQEILQNGKLENYEGHHINSVKQTPEQQGNPDNVIMLEEHRDGSGPRKHYDAHDRNWKKQTTGELLDRDGMLKKTNFKRLLKNELTGLGIAVAIGIGVGFTISFIVGLAQAGVSSENFEKVLFDSAKGTVETGAMSAVGYLIGRGAAYTLQKIGVDIASNLGMVLNMAVIGVLTIAVFSAYQYWKLRRAGMYMSEALSTIGKQVAFSLAILTVSIIAQGVWGGIAGIIVSTSAGLLFLTYSVVVSTHQRKIGNLLREFTIEQYKPNLT